MIPLLDLKPFHAQIRTSVMDALGRLYDRGAFILGEPVQEFEMALASALNVSHAVGVSSGTDAILCALLACQREVGGSNQRQPLPAAEVITTPFTFVATASAIVRAGLRVRFCDVEETSLGIEPSALTSTLTTNTLAVLAVHLYGQPCRIRELKTACAAQGTWLIEDAAQALGAEVDGRALGDFGELGCYSFFPSKTLGALGDAGAIVTSQRRLAERLRRIRVHGASHKHHHTELGGNYRLDALQAAVLSVKLEHLQRRISLCAEHAVYYRQTLGGVAELWLPPELPGETPAYSLFTLRVFQERARVVSALKSAGIGYAIHYPRPLHLQPAFRYLGHGAGDFPVSERLAVEVLSIPMYAELTPKERRQVANTVRKALGYPEVSD